MRIVHLSTNAHGGAARAACRLHRGLRGVGLDSRMLVQFKTDDDPTVRGPAAAAGRMMARLRRHLDSWPVRLYRRRRDALFSPAIVPERLASQVAALGADIVHLHWVAYGFLRIEGLRAFRRPLVWTLHDMWPFTGGCHIAGDCGRYRVSCGQCPILGSSREGDLSRWVWRRKRRAWKGLPLTVVSPSRWLAECAQDSALFQGGRTEVIPLGIDIAHFRPSDQRFARELLSLPQDRRLILWGTTGRLDNPLKGFRFLQAGLRELTKMNGMASVELVVFGSSEPADPPDLPVRAHFLGRLRDDVSLALLYAAGDVLAVPSPQENFPQVAVEALACGTPVVAFATTGLLDVVEHQGNGYLAEPLSAHSLAQGLAWVLEDGERRQALSRRARQKAEAEFSLQVMAQRYADLYRDILGERS
ncbi:MAG: glycosyltransferase family 4 protein [Anaerolineae bacterium]|nr:glycosyltransferase family 4 protein [Anaerolineae bacterium]